MYALSAPFKKGRRFYSSLFIIVLVAGICSCFISYDIVHKRALSSLESKARTIATLIDQNQLALLTATADDLNKPAYLQLKELLGGVRKYNADVRFVYLVAEREGRIYFYVDSETASSPDSSPAGQEYTEAPQGLRDAFATGNANVVGPYNDRWGSWISGFVPVETLPGGQKTILGMDIDATSHTRTVRTTLSFIIFITLFLLSVIVISYRLRRKAEEIINVKSDFIALASHELRSPLTRMRWKLSAVMNDPNTPQSVKDALQDVQVATLRLITMSSSILETTASEHDAAIKNDIRPSNLSLAISGAIIAVRDAMNTKHITIDLDKIFNSEVWVIGEVEKLELAITNIFSNAIKYSPEGSSIEVTLRDEGKKKVLIISDHGMGIPQGDVKHIFDGFHRARNAVRSGARGSGFGLYMTKKIITFYGGKIECESRLDHGSTFIVTLPSPEGQI